MTLREKLADLIAGGALTRADYHYWRVCERNLILEDQAREGFRRAYLLKERLNRIIATVRRMARIAREALQ